MKRLIPLVLAATLGASAVAAEGDTAPHGRMGQQAPTERHGSGPGVGRAVAALALPSARTDAKLLALLTPEQRKQAQRDGPPRGLRRGPRY